MIDENKIVILPISPDRLDDFLAFFENSIPESEWGYRCYCAAFCGEENCSEEGMEKPEVRKAAAVRYIRGGTLRGYLAYADRQVIGWCSANDRNACRKCFGVKWIVGTQLAETEKKGKSVFCFEIAPEIRGRGVASMLLDRVISDAAKEGYAFVEAYPAKKADDETENYAGPAALYEKAGFSEVGETENCTIMRKNLSPAAD